MSENSTQDDREMIAEALRRMKLNKPGIPAQKVREFLNKLQAEWDAAGELPAERVREMFQRFIAEAHHVPG